MSMTRTPASGPVLFPVALVTEFVGAVITTPDSKRKARRLLFAALVWLANDASDDFPEVAIDQ
ncbi:hypothetical protein N599_23785 [Saccharopolyspora erythraea D]|nr:hypothetical protein N599_23785 [Saccharopolyspora erythraea D]